MKLEIILNAVGNFLCCINLIWIYLLIIKSKQKKWKFVIFASLIGALLQTIISLFLITHLKTLFTFLFIFCTCFLIYKKEVKETVFYALYIWAFGMIVDVLFMILLTVAVGTFKDFFANHQLLIIYTATIALQIICNLLFRIKLHQIIINKLKNGFMKLNLAFTIAMIIVLILEIVGTLCVDNLTDLSKIFLFSLLGFFSIWIVILQLMLYYNSMISKDTNYWLIENNKFYLKANNDNRVFKHNLIHKLNGIKSIGDRKTKDLVDEIIKDCKLVSSPKKEEIDLPIGINGIIYQKIYQFDHKKLNIVVDSTLKEDFLELIRPRNYNRLCEVLGVVLDNALEAALVSNDRLLSVNISDNQNNIIITISNSFSNSVDLDKIGSIDYSTKGLRHGLGLFSILTNKDIKTNIRIHNNIFEISIKVSKKRTI